MARHGLEVAEAPRLKPLLRVELKVRVRLRQMVEALRLRPLRRVELKV